MRDYLSRFFGNDVAALGRNFAATLAARLPLSLGHIELKKLSANRITRILEKIYEEAQSAKQTHKLGIFRRTRLCHAFKWQLLDMGYGKQFVDLATEGLVVYLSKPNNKSPKQKPSLTKSIND